MDLDTVDMVERAFAALATGGVSMPPGLTLPLAGGDGAVDVATARIDGLDSYAVKILSGLRDTPDIRRPGRDGLVVNFSADTGAVAAVFLDNGYLTDLGTAAAGAVAARYLAPEDVTTAGVIGAGAQASLQIKAARLVRSFERVLVYGRNPQNAAACAADLAASLPVEVEVTTDPEILVRRSQLVVTATSAQVPILKLSGCTTSCMSPPWAPTRSGATRSIPRALPGPICSFATTRKAARRRASCAPRAPPGCSSRPIRRSSPTS
jgi:ornithine cyclodeaminase/alanine dehydrogenase-like protein (mu-crystallin family)